MCLIQKRAGSVVVGFNLRNEKGDTIIEVLIAVAIVSSVLAISYSIMNLNLQLMRNNQERTEASKIAQGQIEQLKDAWNTADPDDFPIGSTAPIFCMAPGVTEGFGANAAHADIYQDNYANYHEDCIYDFYYTSIKYNDSSGYTVRVRWDGLNGQRNEVLMGYKLQ